MSDFPTKLKSDQKRTKSAAHLYTFIIDKNEKQTLKIMYQIIFKYLYHCCKRISGI